MRNHKVLMLTFWVGNKGYIKKVIDLDLDFDPIKFCMKYESPIYKTFEVISIHSSLEDDLFK